MTEGLGMFYLEDEGREFNWDEYNEERARGYELYEKLKQARESEYLERAAEVCRQSRQYE